MRESKINPKILREIAILLSISLLAGFLYTFITKQGFFRKEENKKVLEMINLEKVKDLMSSGEAILIDSRHRYEYKEGHIKGAINIPLSEFKDYNKTFDSIQKSKILVIYCDGTECNSSFELASRLIDIGYTNVKIFYGGWQEWKQNKLPMESNK